MSPAPAKKTFPRKLKRWARGFDAWVGRLIGKLEPRGRRRLAVIMGVCAAISLAVGAVVHLVMQSHGTLTEDDSPFGTGAVIAACFGYVTFKARTYKPPPMTADQQHQHDLRLAWKQQRSLAERRPWPLFMAWPEPRGSKVAVLIIRRDPDGTFTTDLYATIAGESTAEDGAELMWQARMCAEQAEVDAIAAHEIAQAQQRDALSAQRDAQQRQRDTAERAAREAAAQARDQRIETEGLAAAMRESARRRP
jgi:hypothetical protein